MSNSNNIEKTSHQTQNFYVAGIGSSAGGLEALQRFFQNMPIDSGIAFIIIQHLSPDFKSLMVELLEKFTPMKIIRAEDNMEVQPNCIYLIPPKKNMTIFHRKLHLEEQDRDLKNFSPINIFFQSLAEDQGDKAIGIILSGTGSDGTLGVRAIKENAGVVLLQDASTAKFGGMPNSALASGFVDFICPPEKMPEILIKYIRHPYFNPKESETVSFPAVEQDIIGSIIAKLSIKKDIDLTHYKRDPLIRRIKKRVNINQFNDLETYYLYLQQNPKEIDILHQDLLIGVTRFFRDAEAFAFIEKNIIPNIFLAHKTDKNIRIWSVGCSTGEEAYSLAFLLSEYMHLIKDNYNIKIFATDIDKNAIQSASSGLFFESTLTDIPNEIVNQYFMKKDKKYQVTENIRRMIIFTYHNVIKDPPFSKIDLIVCRNLLIYFQPSTQTRVLSIFHYALNQGGFLFLGPSETVGDSLDKFSLTEQKWKIFQSKGGFKPKILSELENISYPIVQTTTASPLKKEFRTLEKNLLIDIQEALNAIYLPPAVLINEDYAIIHIYNDVNFYLKVSPGQATLNILKMCQRQLLNPLNTAINKALQDNQRIQYDGIQITENSETRLINLIVIPFKLPKYTMKFFFIAFEDSEKTVKTGEIYNLELNIHQRIDDLETELQNSKESLQATIEELETSNEELQATNEELIVSNEELQSTNEELQSVNEELSSVNFEYQSKIEELVKANNDLDILMTNFEMGIIILDKKLCIRRYSTYIVKEINILNGDIGRPIENVSHNLLLNSFLEDIKKVQSLSQSIEKNVRSKSDCYYRLNIRPYFLQNQIVDGIIITLVKLDVTPESK